LNDDFDGEGALAWSRFLAGLGKNAERDGDSSDGDGVGEREAYDFDERNGGGPAACESPEDRDAPSAAPDLLRLCACEG